MPQMTVVAPWCYIRLRHVILIASAGGGPRSVNIIFYFHASCRPVAAPQVDISPQQKPECQNLKKPSDIGEEVFSKVRQNL